MKTALWLIPFGTERDVWQNVCQKKIALATPITGLDGTIITEAPYTGSGGTLPDLVTPPDTVITCLFCPEEFYGLLSGIKDAQELYVYPDGFSFASFSPFMPWQQVCVHGYERDFDGRYVCALGAYGAGTAVDERYCRRREGTSAVPPLARPSRRVFLGAAALAASGAVVFGAAAKGEKLNNAEITVAKRTKIRKFCEDKKHAEWPKAKLDEAFKAGRTKEREVARGVAKHLCRWKLATLDFMYLGTE